MLFGRMTLNNKQNVVNVWFCREKPQMNYKTLKKKISCSGCENKKKNITDISINNDNDNIKNNNVNNSNNDFARNKYCCWPRKTLLKNRKHIARKIVSTGGQA